MSTEKTVEVVPIVPATAPQVVRNGITKTLVDEVFGKMHKLAGHRFWSPKIDVTNADDVSWAVAESLNDIINHELRLIFGAIYRDCLEENTDETTGKVNTEAFIQQMQSEWADFTAGSAKLADLNEQIEALEMLMAPIAMNPLFLAPEGNEEASAEFIKLSTEMRSLGKRMSPLIKQRNSIKEVYKNRAAKRKAKEAASPTQTAAPATVK